MKETKTINSDDLDALEYLRNISKDGVIRAIRSLCLKKRITEQFINEYKDCITPDVFSTAAGLTYELIEKYPELFNLNTWIDYNKRSLEPLKSKNFLNSLSHDQIYQIVKSVDGAMINEEIFDSLYANSNDKLKQVLLTKNLPFTFKKDFLVKNSDFLTFKSFKNPCVSNALDTASVETILNQSPRSIFIAIAAIGCKQDIAWQLRMYNEIENKKIIVLPETVDKDACTDIDAYTCFDMFKYQIQKLQDTVLIEFFSVLKEYAQSAVDYLVLKYALQTRDLSEDACLLLLPDFKEAHLTRALLEYATDKGYSSVIVGLAF